MFTITLLMCCSQPSFSAFSMQTNVASFGCAQREIQKSQNSNEKTIENEESSDENQSADDSKTAENESRKIPVIMYHSILNSRKSRYVVSQRQFEQDIKILKENGFESVFPSEVVNFAKGISSLPQKPIIITFDDGHYNNYYYGVPILQKYGFVATINIVGAFSQFSSTSGDSSNANYSHLTWSEIKECHDSKIIEFGSHTYNLHKYNPRYGVAQRRGESLEDYRQNIKTDILKLQDKFLTNCGFATTTFAYPFGKYNQNTIDILTELGFEIMFTCNEHTNEVSVGDTKVLHKMGRFNREGYYSSQKLLQIVSK